MTHTPGPWTLDEVRTSSGRAFRIGTGEMLVAGKGCCIIYDDYPGGDKSKQREANARLIAAAPDMLAVLDEIEGALDEQLYDNPTVKSARNNDVELAPDCEHHVIITEALRQKITRILNRR